MENLKASELRIGNLISEFGIITTVNSRILQRIESANERNKIIIDLAYVPITEEKLLQLGFTKTYNEEDIFDYYLTVGRKAFILSLADYGDTDFHVLYRCDIGIDFCSLTYIDYIHQIQNIVFDLTETELTIK